MILDVDWDRYVRSRFRLANDDGRMGFDHGVRRFDCPLCGETRGRAWLNVARQTVGCWNGGCPMHAPGFRALDLVLSVEGLRSRRDAVRYLRQNFPALGGVLPPVPRVVRRADWCVLPSEMLSLDALAGSVIGREAYAFCARQWSVPPERVPQWIAGACLTGRYAQRLIIPFRMHGALVAFQARTLGTAQPKYLTSRPGLPGDDGAECGRDAGALLFNYDSIAPGAHVLLVEGVGDVFGWESRADRGGLVAVALLGLTLTDEKLALLSARRPASVTLAVDATEDADEVRRLLASLRAWGFVVREGAWAGPGKDAGEGARLEICAPRLRRLGCYAGA